MAQQPMLTVRADGVQRRDAASLTDDVIGRIAARCPDPSILEERPPFVFQATISTGALDSWYTKMAPSTLRQFARDATEGRSFLPAHRQRGLPIGATIDGRHDASGVGSVTAILYTVPGLSFDGVSTDDVINGIRAGVLRDVSVGFLPGRFACSVCSGDPFDWVNSDCAHIPGVAYDRDGRPAPGGTVCWANVEDAGLSEVSVVHDGATPGAEISGILRAKVVTLVGTGRVTPGVGAVLTRAAAGHPRVDSERPPAPARWYPGHQTGNRPGHRESYEIGTPEQFRMPGGRW